MKIDHIGIAVKDLKDTIVLYKKIFEETTIEIEEIPSEKVRVAMIPLGDTRIELLEPTSDDSAIARFINDKGEGVHHIAIAVRDIKASIARLSTQGFRFIYPEPRPGSKGKMITFIHPKSSKGVLLELCQLPQ
jgi:methylmalonyl-CoA/ethylmalonyl-CoA epimerase